MTLIDWTHSHRPAIEALRRLEERARCPKVPDYSRKAIVQGTDGPRPETEAEGVERRREEWFRWRCEANGYVVDALDLAETSHHPGDDPRFIHAIFKWGRSALARIVELDAALTKTTSRAEAAEAQAAQFTASLAETRAALSVAEDAAFRAQREAAASLAAKEQEVAEAKREAHLCRLERDAALSREDAHRIASESALGALDLLRRALGSGTSPASSLEAGQPMVRRLGDRS